MEEGRGGEAVGRGPCLHLSDGGYVVLAEKLAAPIKLTMVLII
jgi:hypothetical protein